MSEVWHIFSRDGRHARMFAAVRNWANDYSRRNAHKRLKQINDEVGERAPFTHYHGWREVDTSASRLRLRDRPIYWLDSKI